MKTYRQYERALLESLIPKYIAKSGDGDGIADILAQIRLECHNPFKLSCMVLDDAGTPMGFVVASIVLMPMGKRVIIDHAYVPNMGIAPRIYGMIEEKLGTDDIWWVTYRDPSAWIRMFKKHGKEVKLHGYLVRRITETEKVMSKEG